MNGKSLRFFVGVVCVCALTACGSSKTSVSDTSAGNTDGGASNSGNIIDTEFVYAYRENSPYEDVLADCVLVGTTAESCKLSVLPFIGDGSSIPSTDDIMNRVLVTHDWMGERFEQFLQTAPEEMLMMFSSTTAIVMGSKVRPSFFAPLNGAISIDPVHLWASVEEKQTISVEDDYRSSFGQDLQFDFRSRLVDQSGNRAIPFFSISDDSERTFADLENSLARVLFHELTHATDFMPIDFLGTLDPQQSAYTVIQNLKSSRRSVVLYDEAPLTSSQLQDFAGIRFANDVANDAQKAATAADVGALMEADGAIQFYSYFSIYEDIAQLVEGVMMEYHYDSLVNIGSTVKPPDPENITCNDLPVQWGQRNRRADALVSGRSYTATELIVGVSDELAAYLNNSTSSAEPMDIGVNWCDNHAITNDTAVAAMQPQVREPRIAASNDEPVAGSRFMEMLEAENTEHSTTSVFSQ